MAVDECPKSMITAQSISWIEEYLVWRRLGLRVNLESSVRQIEAFLILEEQVSFEKPHGAE